MTQSLIFFNPNSSCVICNCHKTEICFKTSCALQTNETWHTNSGFALKLQFELRFLLAWLQGQDSNPGAIVGIHCLVKGHLLSVSAPFEVHRLTRLVWSGIHCETWVTQDAFYSFVLCVQNLRCHSSQQKKELAQTFKCIHTDYSVSEGTHSKGSGPKCWYHTSVLCHPDVTLRHIGR